MEHKQDCQAIQERKALTAAIHNACIPQPSLVHRGPFSDGSQEQLDHWFSVLRGIVAEYADDGDQILENCDCQRLDNTALYNLAGSVGEILTRNYPAVKAPGMTSAQALPGGKALEEIADHLTLFIAEVLQSYLDAGSERDVTLEELYDPIYKHIQGWSDEVG